MKHDSKDSSDTIARKVIEEYFRNDNLSDHEKDEFISKIQYILRD